MYKYTRFNKKKLKWFKCPPSHSHPRKDNLSYYIPCIHTLREVKENQLQREPELFRGIYFLNISVYLNFMTSWQKSNPNISLHTSTDPRNGVQSIHPHYICDFFPTWNLDLFTNSTPKIVLASLWLALFLLKWNSGSIRDIHHCDIILRLEVWLNGFHNKIKKKKNEKYNGIKQNVKVL